MSPTSTDEITAFLAQGRAEIESLMQDTVRITRPATEDDPEWVPQELDTATGQYPEQGRVVVYEGKCRFQVKADINSNVVETTAGEREWTYLTAQLQVPIAGTLEIRTDHVAQVLTCPNDPDLVDRLFNIMGSYHKSQAAYRRFRVRELVQ